MRFSKNAKRTKEFHGGAVIVAAGSGTRMNNSQNKILMGICGLPVIWHTILAFEQSVAVDEIVVVAKEIDIPSIMDITNDAGFRKVKTITTGGETRQESVGKGLEALSAHIDVVGIHDGARPCVLTECIDDVFITAYEYGAAILAVPAKDTIKVVDGNFNVISTPDRKSIYLAQTPQVFKRDMIETAYKTCMERNIEVTDDCQMAEVLGITVKAVLGEYENIKITTPEDLLMAEMILRGDEIG